jgi:subtilisin family serine protease
MKWDVELSGGIVRTAPWAALVISVATATPAMANPTAAAPNHRYFHFDEPRTLQLDVRRVAIHTPEHAENAEQHRFGEWRLVDVPQEMRHAEGVERLVRGLAAAGDEAQRSFVSPVFFDDLGGPLIVTPIVLVRFFESVPAMLAEFILEGHGLGIERDVLEADWAGMSSAYRVRPATHNGFEVLRLANALAQRPETIFAEPDMAFSGRKCVTSMPNDPFFPSLWGLRNVGQTIGLPCGVGAGAAGFDMRAIQAWAITSGDPSIVVVVIDDGVQFDHPDLLALPPVGGDFTGQAGGGWPVNPCDNHGTPVAGCVGALRNNSLGTVGIAPDVRIASARAFVSIVSTPCDSSWSSQSSWTVAALDWTLSIGARVTNNSNSYGFQSAAIASKYAQLRTAGVVHFASAGNDSSSSIAYPASLPTVNAVAALNRVGQLAWFSNWGAGLAFTAPGEHIISTDRTGTAGYSSGDYMCFSGTSAASPYAAGVAALVLSADPSLMANDVEWRMQKGAIDLGAPGYDTTFGWGLVNAHASLPTPGPDACPTAPTITDGVVQIDNTGLTTTGPAEPCFLFGDDQVHNDAWYRYEATCTGLLIVTLCETGFPAKLAIYGSECPSGSGKPIACDVTSCLDTPRPMVSLLVQAGQAFHIRAGGLGELTGVIRIDVACTPLSPGDLNGDGMVDVLDLLILLDAWGDCENPAYCPADLDGDGSIDVLDLLTLLDNWG